MAQELVEPALTTGQGVVNQQVVQEFLIVVTSLAGVAERRAPPAGARDPRTLHTQDLQAGRRFDSLTVVDPFS